MTDHDNILKDKFKAQKGMKVYKKGFRKGKLNEFGKLDKLLTLLVLYFMLCFG